MNKNWLIFTINIKTDLLLTHCMSYVIVNLHNIIVQVTENLGGSL